MKLPLSNHAAARTHFRPWKSSGSATLRLQPSSLRAFSLVEVTIAMLVVGIALVGMTQAITTALASTKDSELQTTAALFAAGQIEAIRADGYFYEGVQEGDCGAMLPLYRWRQTVIAAGIEGLHEIQVSVEDTRSGQEIYELRTLLFKAPGALDSTNSVNSGGSGRSGGAGS